MLTKQNPSLLETIIHETQSRPFSFHHTIVSPEFELTLYQHWHNEIEFFYLEKGETIFFIEEQEYHLKAGEAILVPPNHLHMAIRKNVTDCEYFAFVFTPSYFFGTSTGSHYIKYIQPLLHSGLRLSMHIKQGTSWQEEILRYLSCIFKVYTNSLDCWELHIHGTVLMIWQILYNHHLSTLKFSNNILRNMKQLETTIEYIHHYYDSEIILNDLATLSNLSEGQFCRLFKQLTGFSPFNYINRYRILKSCEYLSLTTKKIAEIATLCGFNNISYFNRVFINIMKITPSAYRNSKNSEIG